ncbi:hypothetical protein [Arthrobacter sp. HY1533]|uniref:hypothetical protein n=1 Tax=Arthrobacter sp. HY1533 TaxID=2970919 RepID=UPI0022BA097B|nr:hypothetical protein [Arthrobacter sp. HY1533]
MSHPRAIPIATTILLTAGLLGGALASATATPATAMARTGLVGAELDAATAAADSTFGNGGIAGNSPHSGSKLAYLDGGSANSLAQRFTVTTAGTFLATAWITSERAGGKFGIRAMGGEVLSSVGVPANGSCKLYSLPSFAVDVNAVLEVYFTGGAGWTNIDDVAISRDARTLHGFTVAGQQGDAQVDQVKRTVTFQMPYESRLSALTATATLPQAL